MRQANDRPLRDRLTLQQHVDEESAEADADSIDRERVGRRSNQPDARRHLGDEHAPEDDDQQPEGQRLHHQDYLRWGPTPSARTVAAHAARLWLPRLPAVRDGSAVSAESSRYALR